MPQPQNTAFPDSSGAHPPECSDCAAEPAVESGLPGLLFDTADFPPRWDCGQWSPLHGWTHVVADLAIFGAYVAIPVVLIWFIRRRQDIPFPRIFWLFGAFILSCGTVHLIEAGIFWWPAYRLSGAVKVVTAVASWLTVLTLIRLVPLALALPGLAKVNAKLQAEIAERKHAEELSRLVVQSTPSGIVMIDNAGEIVLANAEAERIFGYGSGELRGRSIETLVPARFRDSHPAQRDAYFERPSSRRMGAGRDLYGQRRDGSEVPLEIGLNPVQTEAGSRALASIVDLTARVEAEEKQRRYTAELEALNAQLEETKRTLEETVGELTQSNQELDDFAYVASHDLKEPLRGIHNYATFLMEDYGELLDEEGCRKLEVLPRLSQRLELLIDSLLHFSRVGRLDLALRETDLDTVLDEVLETLHITVDEGSIEIRRPGPLPALVCDGVRVGELLRNLITNAARYNDKAERWIEVGVQGPPDPPAFGAPRVFYVRDNGIGIPVRHQEAVFRIFKRLHGKGPFAGGTGAGLTIVKKIVERHGGRVWLESTEGQGTTFYFTLERDPAAAARCA